MTELITLDPTGRHLYAQLDQLRAAGPAVRVQLPDGVTAWSVSRGDVVKRLLAHPHVAKDARTAWPGYVPYAIPWLYAWVDVRSMFTSDGADHKRLRDLVGKAFLPRRVEALRPAITTLVRQLIGELAAEPAGAVVDLRARYTYRIPTGVICDLFGAPHSLRPRMLELIDSVLDTGLTREQAADVQRDLHGAITDLIRAKAARPGDDMTSLLLAAHADGENSVESDSAGVATLTHDELASTLILMIGAGSETAVALIDHAVLALLTHPDQRATVTADAARWPDVIEETLRRNPPIVHLPLRFATADIPLGEGVTIPAGEAILIAFGAHGRDPDANPDPLAFTLGRDGRDHLAFGHGPHYCLGAPLARLEAEIALTLLFEAFPDLHLACEPGSLTPQPSFIANDLRALPIQLHPPIPQPPAHHHT